MSNNLLKGKKGIIFGALNEYSIVWKVAEQCHAQGRICFIKCSYSYANGCY